MLDNHSDLFHTLIPTMEEAIKRTRALPPADDHDGVCLSASSRNALIFLGSSPHNCLEAIRARYRSISRCSEIETVFFLKNKDTDDVCRMSNDARERHITGPMNLMALTEVRSFPHPVFKYPAALIGSVGGIMIWTHGWEQAIRVCTQVHDHLQTIVKSVRAQGLIPEQAPFAPLSPLSFDLPMLLGDSDSEGPLIESLDHGYSSQPNSSVFTSSSIHAEESSSSSPDRVGMWLEHFGVIDTMHSQLEESLPTSWDDYKPPCTVRDHGAADIACFGSTLFAPPSPTLSFPESSCYSRDVTPLAASPFAFGFSEDITEEYTDELVMSHRLIAPLPRRSSHTPSTPLSSASTPDLVPGSVPATPDSPDIPLALTFPQPLPSKAPTPKPTTKPTTPTPSASRKQAASDMGSPDPASSPLTSMSNLRVPFVDDNDFEPEPSDDEEEDDEDDDDAYHPSTGSSRKKQGPASQRKRFAATSPRGEPQAIRVPNTRAKEQLSLIVASSSMASPTSPLTFSPSSSSDPLYHPPPGVKRRPIDYPSRTADSADYDAHECKFCIHPRYVRSADAERHVRYSCWLNPNRERQECPKCGVDVSRDDALTRHRRDKCKGKRGSPRMKGCVRMIEADGKKVRKGKKGKKAW